MHFVNKTIALDPRLCSESGILSARDIALLTDAGLVAEKIRHEALEEAARIEESAHKLAQEKVRNAEAAAFERAAAMIKQLDAQRQAFLVGCQDLLLDMVNAAIDRLMLDMTHSEKIAACLARIKAEAPARLQNAVLHVSSDDLPKVPAIDWRIVADPSMQAGSCRLEAEGGVWEVNFSVAVEALKSQITEFKNITE